MDNETVAIGEGEVNEALEREARGMGWNPDHKGDNFISAKDFVDRGKNILPIVQATNQRLRGELAEVSAQAAATASQLRAVQASQAALEEGREADLAEARKQERAQVKAELARASEAGDHAAVAEATDDLTRLNTEEAEAKRIAEERTAARGNDTVNGTDRGDRRPAPEVMAWLKANPDFARDPEKIALGNVIGSKLKQEQPDLKGSAFLDEVAIRVEKRLGGTGIPGKVESGGARGSSGGGGGNGKSYNDLPADAKAVCDRQAAKFVGANRAHKDNASWQRAYAIQYFNQK